MLFGPVFQNLEVGSHLCGSVVHTLIHHLTNLKNIPRLHSRQVISTLIIPGAEVESLEA